MSCGCGSGNGSTPGGVVALPGSGGSYDGSQNNSNGSGFFLGRFCFKCTTFWIIIAIGLFILITRNNK